MVMFNKVEEEKEFQEAAKLEIGKHLVKIVKAVETKKDGTVMADKNGTPFWLVVFQDKDEQEHAETFFWGGSMAWKTARLLKAIGELEANEDIETCGKEFQTDDILGAHLYITIEEDKNATNEKYKYRIEKEGFEPYGDAKPEPKKATSKAPF